eukprot:TRINITY_DN11270_c0_g1_i1.p1 TRINITY_DN11270_c0_g1~~TRINITY_DN11270_c0_g1_i1.p1  ORF type:complete len:207 (-),score=34.00 TRINITY_DN11270_c0_g1_i1:40-621(-)
MVLTPHALGHGVRRKEAVKCRRCRWRALLTSVLGAWLCRLCSFDSPGSYVPRSFCPGASDFRLKPGGSCQRVRRAAWPPGITRLRPAARVTVSAVMGPEAMVASAAGVLVAAAAAFFMGKKGREVSPASEPSPPAPESAPPAPTPEKPPPPSDDKTQAKSADVGDVKVDADELPGPLSDPADEKTVRDLLLDS